ncbi:hypothetical protein, partial [Plasmodium yoelii yoelii]
MQHPCMFNLELKPKYATKEG